jgi:O-antigen/teichoic acid export membrane protein
MIYHISFNMITLAGRTILGIYYSTEVMGYYTLANTITNGTLLGFKAVLWVFFPLILFKTRSEVADVTALTTIRRVNSLFNTSVMLIVFGMIIISPVLFIILPQYKPALEILALLLLAQAILLVSFGFNSLAIARNEEMKVAIISLVAVVFVVGAGLLVAYFQISPTWIANSVLLGSIVFTVLQIWISQRLISSRGEFFSLLRSILPWGSVISIAVCWVGIMTGFTLAGGIAGFLIYSIANRNAIQGLISFVIQKFS